MNADLSLSEISVSENGDDVNDRSTTLIQNFNYDVNLSDDNKRLVFVSSDENCPIANFVFDIDDLLWYKIHNSSLITCYFIVRAKNYIWKLLYFNVNFTPKSKKARIWTACFKNIVRGPDKLLFIVNPVSGDRSASDYFANRIEPLLKNLEIEYEAFYTKKENDATEFCSKLRENNLTEFDGVVLLSGDGTLNEAVRGLMSFDENGELKPAPLPVGIIPCGTSNTLAYTIHGTEDRDTALFHILLADRMNIDVMSVTDSSGNLLGFSLTLVAFGFIADAIQDSERYKSWLKSTTRYTLSFSKAIIKMKKYNTSFKLWQPQSDNVESHFESSGVICQHNCLICSQSIQQSDEIESSEQEIVPYSEPNLFFANFYNHPGRCRLAPHGGAPYAHIADGLLHIRIAGNITRSQVSEILKATGDTKGPAKPPDCLKCMTAQKVWFQHTGTGSGNGCLILDGEIKFAQEIGITCHHQVLPFFGRGLESSESESGDLIHLYGEEASKGCLDNCTIL